MTDSSMTGNNMTKPDQNGQDLTNQDLIDQVLTEQDGRPSRREALQVFAAAGGGLMIGYALPGTAAARILSPFDKTASDTARLHAYIRISPDNKVEIVCGKSEMGQGALTGYAQVVGDELDCAWDDITVVPSPVHPVYGIPPYGFMITGGSTTIRAHWMQLRKAGAAARHILRQAAAKKWKVPLAQVRTEAGRLTGPGGRKATYGDFADAAAKLTTPKNTPLKPKSQRTMIGKPLKRVDTAEKVNGTAKYGMDVRLPGMLTAVIAFPPDIGGKMGKIDDSAALKVPGVRQVVKIRAGVAIVADHYWAAVKGREALKVDWQPGPFAKLDSDGVRRSYTKALEKKGRLAETRGDTAKAPAAKTLNMDFEQPFLAQACMEPMNCTVQITPQGAEIWAPIQSQTIAQQTVAAVTGLPPKKVKINTMLLGGGFGRRSAPDFVVNATEIAKAVSGPVRLVYSREDDMRGAFYRPFSMTRVKAKIGDDKKLSALEIRVAVSSVAKWTRFKPLLRPDGIDSQTVEGFHDLPYAIPNLKVEWVEHDLGIPIWFWRSVGASHNPFVLESAIDEVAHASGQDPYQFRRAMLTAKPRHRAVLDRAAKEAGWTRAPAKGVARGIALVESFGSICAQVAEVRMDAGDLKVERITCVIDCGVAVNPQQIVAQMEGNIAYGLSALLDGKITLKNGRPEQDNFDSYLPLRMNEMPQVDVHIIEGAAVPGGVGEPGLPPLLPAVANAVFALTGKRHRQLPLRNSG